jgi:16S rRNA (uracil1498-N3)-methyltransferase
MEQSNSLETYNSAMVPRFFCPMPLAAGRIIMLPPQVAHHVERVLRLRVGDPVVLFDGVAGEYRGTLESLGSNPSVALSAWQEIEREARLDLVLAQALPAGDKMDWIVQKAVELGVRRLIPLAAERSVVRLAGERAARRVAHWQQVAVAACEQCGRNRVPQVEEIRPLPDWLAQAQRAQGTRLVLAPDAEERVGGVIGAGSVVLLVGPEGGFAEGEQVAIRACGFAPVSLGPRTLRTETAGLAALAALLAAHGEM